MKNNISAMTPKEVKQIVSIELKRKRITHAEAAKALGMKTRQSFSNLMTIDRYFSPGHAEALSQAYGFNYDFLNKGEGYVFDLKVDSNGEPLNPVARILPRMQMKYRITKECLDVVVNAEGSPEAKELLHELEKIIQTLDRMALVDSGDVIEDIMHLQELKEKIKNKA